MEINIIKSSRKTIGIIVHSNGEVTVRAPHRATKKQIDEVITRRMSWIHKHKKRFAEIGATRSKQMFVNGEKHCFLGKEYSLKIVPAAKNRVFKNEDFIIVECADESIVESLMEQWYSKMANNLMPEIIMPVVDSFKKKHHKTPAKISFKSMKTRWGSCSSRGNISMNVRLIKSCESCIEYVMAHELCHLVEMNHSKNYYALLTDFMPDWRSRKSKLLSL